MRFKTAIINGYCFYGQLNGSIKEYSIMWTALTNVTRVMPEIIELKNYSDNHIKVIIDNDDGSYRNVRDVQEILATAGMVIEKGYDVKVAIPIPEYENDEEYEYEICLGDDTYV